MNKFKTLFRKAHHGTSNSNSGGGGGNSKNKNDKSNLHLGSAVSNSSSNKSSSNSNSNFHSNIAAASTYSFSSTDNKEFEKPVVTSCSGNSEPVTTPPAPSPLRLSSNANAANAPLPFTHAMTESSINSQSSKLISTSVESFRNSGGVTCTNCGVDQKTNMNTDEATDELKKQLHDVLKEKSQLESRLKEMIKNHGELEDVKKELESLKTQKNEFQNNIIMRIGNVDHINGHELVDKNSNRQKHSNSAPASIAPPVDSSEMLDAHELDENFSGSEMSVACLQDRISRMEETHYSTNEELQATLVELNDLQSQLTALQNDNERLGEEKDVLLESLCRQTEKLEDARSKVDTLQDLLTDKSIESFSEREQKLMLLLKDSQQNKEDLQKEQNDLRNKLHEFNVTMEKQKQEANNQTDRIHFLESTVEGTNAELKAIQNEFSNSKEENACKNIEINRLGTLLENARNKIEKFEEAREKDGNENGIDDLIDSLRKDKDNLEMSVASLQEQLSISLCEVNKLKDQLAHVQEEHRVTRNNAKSAMDDAIYKCQNYKEDIDRMNSEIQSWKEKFLDLEVQCQCHLDDIKKLKDVLLETQKRLEYANSVEEHLKTVIEEEKKMRNQEQSEWDQFQNDLLMTVRVANDLKTETQCELERLIIENKQLQDRIKILENKITSLANIDNMPTPLLQRTLSNNETSLLSSWSHEFNRRNNACKRLSVKSLIETIESAHKQAKTGNGCIRSQSASSLQNLAGQFSGPSSCSTDTDLSLSSLTQSKDPCEVHPTSQNCENHLSPSNSFILANVKGTEFNAMKQSTNESGEKKDPLQALVKNGGSKRNALLKWCQNKVSDSIYSNIEKITNFSSSWNDGMALCALLHSYLPEKVPYDSLNSTDKKRNFTIAFDAAESVGIPTTLDINYMIEEERPDWKKVMAYVTSIFRHFES